MPAAPDVACATLLPVPSIDSIPAAEKSCRASSGSKWGVARGGRGLDPERTFRRIMIAPFASGGGGAGFLSKRQARHATNLCRGNEVSSFVTGRRLFMSGATSAPPNTARGGTISELYRAAYLPQDCLSRVVGKSEKWMDFVVARVAPPVFLRLHGRAARATYWACTTYRPDARILARRRQAHRIDSMGREQGRIRFQNVSRVMARWRDGTGCAGRRQLAACRPLSWRVTKRG